MKTAFIAGCSGFIGMALTRRLKDEGYLVTGVDIRRSPFGTTDADEFYQRDLRHAGSLMGPHLWKRSFDEVYMLAAHMGGAGYIFTGEHDADVIADNVLINTNIAQHFSKVGCGRLLYTSSSCVYNDRVADSQYALEGWRLREKDAYPAHPSNSYGWEKLFCEQLYEAHRRNYGLNVCITRFSTIYGPGSAFDDGREKAVAAIIRKVLDAPDGGDVEVWGDGQQVRPLVYIDDLLDAITALVRCKTFNGPVNIANDEHTTCDDVAKRAIDLSGKRLTIKHVPGPIGKQTLTMTTDVAWREFGWRAQTPFALGIVRTFDWIEQQKAKRALSLAS